MPWRSLRTRCSTSRSSRSLPRSASATRSSARRNASVTKAMAPLIATKRSSPRHVARLDRPEGPDGRDEEVEGAERAQARRDEAGTAVEQERGGEHGRDEEEVGGALHRTAEDVAREERDEHE